MAISQRKKVEWFNLGAAAFERVCPGMFDEPVYPCPICLRPFSAAALIDGRLSTEHVPPRSVGGRKLLLTCKGCNNSAGTKLDADAKAKERVRTAMAGDLGQAERVRVRFGDLVVNGELHTSEGRYSLHIPQHINRPGTNEVLREVARAGALLTLQSVPYAELGAKVSWLRSGGMSH